MNRASGDQRPAGWTAVRYRLEVRLSDADVGSRVVIRWRRPAGSGDEVADVLGVLAVADDASFTVRKSTGELVIIPRDRALAGPDRARRPAPRAGNRNLAPGSRHRPFGIMGLLVRQRGMTMVWGDPAGFAVDWDWQRGLPVGGACRAAFRAPV